MPLHFVSTRREEFYLWGYQMLFFFLDCWNSTERWIYSVSPLTLLRRWDLAKVHWSAIMQRQATCRLSVLSAFTPTLMWKNKRVSNTIVTGQWVILSPWNPLRRQGSDWEPLCLSFGKHLLLKCVLFLGHWEYGYWRWANLTFLKPNLKCYKDKPLTWKSLSGCRLYAQPTVF